MISVDAAATLASDRYKAFVALISATVAGEIKSAGKTAVLTLPTVAMTVQARRYLDGESSEALAVMRSLTREARNTVADHYGSRTDTSPTPPDVDIDLLHNALRLQAEKEMAAGIQALHSFRFDAMNMARIKGMPLTQAYRETAKKAQPVEGNRHVDASRKVWKGDVYVRALWRQAMVQTRAEAALAAIAEHKQTRAVIHHPEPDHKSHGIILSLTGDDGYPTWRDVRAEHFHPNSRALILPYGGRYGVPV